MATAQLAERRDSAIQGRGAYLNNKRIATSQTSTLEKAIVHVGDIMKENNPEVTKQRLEDISELFLNAGRVRLIGSAAIDLAYVACGRADMLVNHAIQSWDVEAGRLLVLEAGGKVMTKQRYESQILSIYNNGLLPYIMNKSLFMHLYIPLHIQYYLKHRIQPYIG